MNSDLSKLENLGFKVFQGNPTEADLPQEEQQQEENIQQTSTAEVANEESSLKENITNTTASAEDSDFGQIVDEGSGSSEKVSASEKETASQPTSFDPVAWYNEKFSTSYKNEDEILSAAKQTSEASKASSELPEVAKALADFINETGRSPLDFFQTQMIDYNKVPDSELIVQDYLKEGISRDEALILFEDEFAKTVITEFMEDDEKAIAERKNKAVDVKLKRRADKVRQDFNSLKEKYKAPIDGYAKPSETQKEQAITPEDRKQWETTMDASLKSLENFKIDLGDGKSFNYSAKQFVDSSAKQLKNPETVFEVFMNENGWDTKAIAEAAFLHKNFESIAKSLYKNAIGQGQKKVVETSKNSNFEMKASGKQSSSFRDPVGEEKTFEFLKQHLDKTGMKFRI